MGIRGTWSREMRKMDEEEGQQKQLLIAFSPLIWAFQCLCKSSNVHDVEC